MVDREELAEELSNQKHTLGFVLCAAYRRVFNRRLCIENSFCDGWWCHDDEGRDLTGDDIKKLKEEMTNLLKSGKVERCLIPRKEALEYFQKNGFDDKLAILKVWRVDPLPSVRIGDYWDYELHPVSIDMQAILTNGFELLQYGHGQQGVLLRFARVSRVSGKVEIGPFKPQPKFFDAIASNEKWGDALDVSTVGALNEKIYKKEMDELLWVSEAFMEKKFADVAQQVIDQYPKKKIICIAGPSSSGKTTSAKRLSIQLRAQGFHALAIGMDDYYKNGEDVPNDGPHGMKDWEALSSINIDLLARRLTELSEGKSVPHRKFDFREHRGTDSTTRFLEAKEKTVIVVEGIHGLNPEFHKKLGPVHKVYVSCLCQLNIDKEHHFSTADNRLLRRTLRDYRTRGYGADDTFTRWPMVRGGEERYIFPNQEEADFVINTSLLHELPILANYVKPLLAEVVSDVPRVVRETERLYNIISLFYPMTDENLPRNSVLTEFTGHSAFEY